MELEVFKIVSAFEAMEGLKQNNELPIKLAWDLEELQSKLKPTFERYQEKRTDLIKKFGTPDKKNPEQYQITADKQSEFSAEIGKLIALKVNLKDLPEIEKTALFAANLKVNKGGDIAAIKPFLK